MSKNKLEPGSITNAEAEIANPEVMAQTEETALAVARPAALGVYDFGQDSAPLTLARIHIAHNISLREPEGTPKGALVLGKDWDCLLCKLGEPVMVLLLGVHKYWKERPEVYDPNAPIRTFATEAEANAAGLVTKWGPYGSNVKPNCCPALDVQMLIRKPEGVASPLFCCVLGNNEYAPAIATFDKKSYSGANQLLQMAAIRDSQVRKVPLSKADLSNFFFTMKTVTYETSRKTKVPYLTLALAVDPRGAFVVPNEEEKTGLAGLLNSSAPMAEEDAAF